MGSDNPNLEAIDERLEGDPIRLGDRSVTPVGRMTGKRFEGGNEHAGGFGMILTLQPEEIIVRESGQEPRFLWRPRIRNRCAPCSWPAAPSPEGAWSSCFFRAASYSGFSQREVKRTKERTMETNKMVNIKPIEQVIENLDANSVFGKPTTEHGVVVIPVAQVSFGFGYGGGYGEGQSDPGKGAAADATPEEIAAMVTEGAGGGAGAGGRVSPRGYIRISPESVIYESIDDQKVIPLAGILMVAWSVFWIAATIRTIAKQVAKTRQARIKNS